MVEAKCRQFLFIGPLGLVMIISFLCTYLSAFENAWAGRSPHYPASPIWNASSLVLLFSATIVFLGAKTALGSQGLGQGPRLSPRIPSWSFFLIIVLFPAPLFLDIAWNSAINKHPIDTLMEEAYEQHQAWVKQASTSNTLRQATDEYRRRYKRHPPPKFDEWYNYATSRSSLIIDDYDSIHEDMLPFWASDPLTLRTRTREMILDPWNEVAEVNIRNGKAEIGPNVLPTHRWMLDGVITMLNNFVQWLPDMDLAFNINDESRVAIPYETLETLKAIGDGAGRLDWGKYNEWSPNRADTWRPIDESVFVQSRFEDHSFHNTFFTYGSIACPPSSPARRTRIWDPRHPCTTCTTPHSLGPFLRNWTLAASPCHQPDLSNLHGFYLSPAAFKTTHSALPVFSQSKAHGYADILYPSPWNYMDKAHYTPSTTHPDPPFAAKQNTLFWRGATSEGVSAHGTWQGMARQRLVHLANNSTLPLPVLLPSPLSAPITPQTKYRTHSLTPAQLRALGLHTDIGIVDRIARCGGPDCAAQEDEFALLAPSDFQAHWRYRFLMDLDGAGFSGRFLPFLQSRSLPFKAAVFREWWDARVRAWVHFVPLDVRLRGLWSTLAYFAGVGEGESGGRVEEGEAVAERGREWAQRVLRKEDMEVYFFRLLLEWGRLTDERRDEIGFQV